MPDTLIANPILNSPFQEPVRHWEFGDEGITNAIAEGRRGSSYFTPIAQSRKKGVQLQFETEWTKDRIKPNEKINQIRERVALWRKGGWVGVTPVTRRLLGYWTDESRERPLFFCQVEALETAIYLTEVAHRYGDAWISNWLRDENETANGGLPRMSFKMATGSGKTVVMAMLIAWHLLNKEDNPQDARFGDAFLVITPGITIKDRLRVLFPNDSGNYYRERDLVPADLAPRLEQARITVTNYHALMLRERGDAARLTKAILTQGAPSPFQESPDQMVRRVCRELGNKKQIVVINDEAHHCYASKEEPEAEGPLSREERAEAKQREEEARVWISGLHAIQKKLGLKTIYDLSATPFFLRGSGYPEGTLFPWVVSDFALIDAIESGIVKVPRVPVGDNTMAGSLPTYRDLWLRIRDDLPKKAKDADAQPGAPIPAPLEGALRSLYGNYEKAFRSWEADAESRARGTTPPVFIVVCNNTSVSKLVYEWIAGWEKTRPDGSKVVVPGNLAVFSNEREERWSPRPNTILVDSAQLESGEGMSPEFKKIAAAEIEEFKADYRIRFPGRDPDELTDEDLLREVMNSVGKAGRLGEQVKCVVSVSMLTEGWDANTVTHVLGVRAFGTQLLCEQVVGRALRRTSYAAGIQRHQVNGQDVEYLGFPPEYAEVYGVPFSFIPCSGSTGVTPTSPVTRVRALEDREQLEISFPRVVGYRYDLPTERLEARFTDESRMVLGTEQVATRTENRPIVGEESIHTLDDLKQRRESEVAFRIAKLLLETWFSDEGSRPEWLFPQLLAITRRWMQECVTLKDDTFPQLLLFAELAHDAADKIYRAIVRSAPGEPAVRPILAPYDTVGSTRHVSFDTAKPVLQTRPDRSHVSHVVLDSFDWEAKVAESIESMDEVRAYVKNDRLGFFIPYSTGGEEHRYIPDYLVALDGLTLIVEVTGRQKKEKEIKVATVRDLWVPAINRHGGFGRWAFYEITDPWNTKTELRQFLAGLMQPAGA